MLEKLTRLLKLKQKLTLDPSANDFFEMDRFSVSRIEVTGRQSCILQVIILRPVQTHSTLYTIQHSTCILYKVKCV